MTTALLCAARSAFAASTRRPKKLSRCLATTSSIPSDSETVVPPPVSYERPSLITPHTVGPRRRVPPHIQRPSYATTGIVPVPMYPEITMLLHDKHSIARMKTAAVLARRALDYVSGLVSVGITTDELDEAVHEFIISEGAYPSPLNYAGFPKSLCTSVNEVICHGIPDSRKLEFGDVISLDVSCYIGGVHGDNCATVIVGDQAERGDETDWRGVPMLQTFDSPQDEARIKAARRLVQATQEGLAAGIEVCRPGGCLSHIGAAIHDVADAYGYDTVQKYRGHGIAQDFHCPPFVKHFRNSDRLELTPGMIFTIEPMITEGQWNCREWDDDWTVVTLDGSFAAQFEHTVLITDTGVEILTLPE